MPTHWKGKLKKGNYRTMNETAICPACAHEQCEDCVGLGCYCDHTTYGRGLAEPQLGSMSCPPCRVARARCPECGDCDCQVDAEDFYDDNEDETMKDGYA